MLFVSLILIRFNLLSPKMKNGESLTLEELQILEAVVSVVLIMPL
jgi:hypothetical protein